MRTLLVLGCLFMAGCAQTIPTESSVDATPNQAGAPAYAASGEAAWAMLNAFVEEAPRRYDNSFQHDAARDFLHERLVSYGYNVTRQAFTGPSQTQGTAEGQNILGTHPGRTNNTIILGAHYDSAITSVEAAYDDGAGTILVWELAQAVASREWNHTFIIAGLDQEEAGLVGSSYMANQLRDDDVPVAMMLNYDMIGINWPVGLGGTANPIAVDFYVGGEREAELVQLWNKGHAQTDYPPQAISSQTGLGGGSSDHGPFRQAEFNAAWMRGALIGSYPAYHNLDTTAAMVAAVGGDEAMLEASFQTVLDLSLAFLVELDSA